MKSEDEACEMWIWHHMLKMCWNPMSSTAATGRKDTDQNLTYTSLNVLIHNSLLRRVTEGKMEGKQTREKTSNTLFDHLINKQLKELAQCNEDWYH